MAMIDKVNGKIRVNCIIMNRGVIPNFGGVMGPILQPRPIDLNEVLLLLKMGVDLRGVDRDKKFNIEDAVQLNESIVNQMINDFKHGKKQQPKQQKPVQQPKQQKPVEQPKPVVEEQPKVQEQKPVEQPKPVVEEQPKVQEQKPVEQPVVKQPNQNKNNTKNKNNNKK